MVPDDFQKSFLSLSVGVVAVMNRLARLYIESIYQRNLPDFYDVEELFLLHTGTNKITLHFKGTNDVFVTT